MNDHLYEHLEQAMEEAENSKRQAFEESTRRRKAEKDTVDALHKVSLFIFSFFLFRSFVTYSKKIVPAFMHGTELTMTVQSLNNCQMLDL